LIFYPLVFFWIEWQECSAVLKPALRAQRLAAAAAPAHSTLSPAPFCREDFKSIFAFHFVPAEQFFPANSSNRAAEVGVGVKWLEGRLGKMAARSDAARRRPPGHPMSWQGFNIPGVLRFDLSIR